jgi:membrane-associated protease RseP (regulator of RpoE activity)
MAQLPTGGLTFGNSLAFTALRFAFSNHSAFVPPMNEVYHYPFLCAGWFGQLVTAMNLLPVGQLDGGHIVRAALPKHKKTFQRVTILVLILLGSLGLVELFEDIPLGGWLGWLMWGCILFLIFRRQSEPAFDDNTEVLSWRRSTVAWAALIILLVTFMPQPFTLAQ